MFDGHRKKDPEERWHTLPDALKTTVCAEFLRNHEVPGVPRLKHLLLPPTNWGRDVDIYGVAEDGTEILAQVPFLQNRDKEGFQAKRKAERLRNYANSGAKLVCFVPGFGGGYERPDQEKKLFEDRSPNVDDEVVFVPVEEVLKWFEKQPAYAEKVFFA
ncbi:MAG: hypothetical protein M3R38_17025 [Actinomycetota bacterium]|nr:hypothetical protein [Actinomycetota bacterium]MDP9485657.1 hypothetical protein [Actinomycetota bacterium]